MARKKSNAAGGENAEASQVGFTRMQAPEDCTSFSHDGEEYEIGDDGTVEVPDAIAAELTSHGFVKAK